MWKKYFGKNTHIYGIDINPGCKELEDDQVTIFIGKQEDRDFIKGLKSKIPRLDILIDDGGHTMMQQIVTFEEMFDHIKEDGIYLCEDTHTSYMHQFYGGLHKKRTFIEYAKNFIDYLHAWPIKNNSNPDMKYFTESVNAVHFFNGVVIIEKKRMQSPIVIRKGKISSERIATNYVSNVGQKEEPIFTKAVKKTKKIIRKLLSYIQPI
jgi:hypothetical protein